MLILVIWYLSFFTPPKTELDNVEFIDKWVHIIMYGGTCGVIWLEYLRRHPSLNAGRLFLMAWLAPVIMSGAIALPHDLCTSGRRRGDWLPLAANTVGIPLAALFGIRAEKRRPKD